MRQSQKDHDESLSTLRQWIKPGDTVYCVLRHVSRSGMSRDISPLVIQNGEHRYLAYHVARVLGLRDVAGAHDAVRINGCGMDMGFELVYQLGRRLFPGGFGEVCTHPGCRYRPSSRQAATQANTSLGETKSAHPHKFRGRNGDTSGWDDDGGYALRHRWL